VDDNVWFHYHDVCCQCVAVVFASGCAGSESSCVSDVCGCVGTMEVCDSSVGKLTCCKPVGLDLHVELQQNNTNELVTKQRP
jgi:hypothetical protein